jgi:transposase
MARAVVLRSGYDGAGLRKLSNSDEDPRQTRRLLAVAAVYDGMSRTDAARIGGMDRQTLRDWAHRFNDEGPDGLSFTR